MEAEADVILSGLDDAATWDAVIEAEPALAVVLSGERFDAALLAIASFVDLKSPYFLGHARAVADLAAEAGARLGLGEGEVRTLRRAGLVHDLGRLGVSNAIWDKRGPLGAGEWERVRLHPYMTERMLRQSEALAPLAAIAVQHRERLDGSGYPRGLSGAGISRSARILGAADAYQAMREPRPHRPALLGRRGRRRAARRRQGGPARRPRPSRRCSGAAGHRVPRRQRGPGRADAARGRGAQAVARGLSNKEIAERLVISPKTVGNHVEHIYAKIDASTRAAAGLFAMRHGLLPEEEFPAPAAGLRRPRIASMFFRITASVSRSSSVGLNMHHLGAGLVLDRGVAGRGVERVTGPEDLLAVGVPERSLAADHVAPVRALAAVVGETLQQRTSRRCPVRRSRS